MSLEDALDHVGGYTILNDVSDRAWQRRQSQWALGKCFDGFAPLGPWLVTADDVPDPQDLLVEVVRDGVVTVSQSTSTTIFSGRLRRPLPEPGHDARARRCHLDRHAAEARRRAGGSPPAARRRRRDRPHLGLGELTTRFIAPQEAAA